MEHVLRTVLQLYRTLPEGGGGSHSSGSEDQLTKGNGRAVLGGGVKAEKGWIESVQVHRRDGLI
jgi:hypothetical protein